MRLAEATGRKRVFPGARIKYDHPVRGCKSPPFDANCIPSTTLITDKTSATTPIPFIYEQQMDVVWVPGRSCEQNLIKKVSR